MFKLIAIFGISTSISIKSCDVGHGVELRNTSTKEIVLITDEPMEERAFKNSSIRITRLICPHCGSTHAVLLSPMIPFISSVSYDDMISIIVHKNTDAEIDNSLISYFHTRFVNCFGDYYHICLFNSRNLFLSFVTTHDLFIIPPFSSILES